MNKKEYMYTSALVLVCVGSTFRVCDSKVLRNNPQLRNQMYPRPDNVTSPQCRCVENETEAFLLHHMLPRHKVFGKRTFEVVQHGIQGITGYQYMLREQSESRSIKGSRG